MQLHAGFRPELEHLGVAVFPDSESRTNTMLTSVSLHHLRFFLQAPSAVRHFLPAVVAFRGCTYNIP
jgi:hypothetical protein